MSAHEYGETLARLHRIHQQLSELRTRLKRGPARVSMARQKLAAIEGNLAATQDAIQKTKMTADRKQLQLKEGEAKIEVTQGKMNAAKGNEEYQILKDQIAAAEMANSVLADEVLEALDKIDQLTAHAESEKLNVAAGEEELKKVQAAADLEREDLEGQVAKAQAELAEVEPRLPAELKADYQRLTKARGEDALAAVDGEECGQCYVSMRPQAFQDLRMGRIVYCSSCGAMLYLPPSD
ncbi:phospholipase [Blastopirellula sp. J2-11]|uniref:zinc ribbon domain-containing protein n=1 Tax=Blastopirellula sp. J2-11 TaxID=2943192 RepID=UPI0021C9A6C5|nr:phospholipase [Blastopirellula sp. J2-11]UUO04459.1 phospholipase [Blastopirellula sp. J2-11]